MVKMINYKNIRNISELHFKRTNKIWLASLKRSYLVLSGVWWEGQDWRCVCRCVVSQGRCWTSTRRCCRPSKEWTHRNRLFRPPSASPAAPYTSWPYVCFIHVSSLKSEMPQQHTSIHSHTLTGTTNYHEAKYSSPFRILQSQELMQIHPVATLSAAACISTK